MCRQQNVVIIYSHLYMYKHCICRNCVYGVVVKTMGAFVHANDCWLCKHTNTTTRDCWQMVSYGGKHLELTNDKQFEIISQTDVENFVRLALNKTSYVSFDGDIKTGRKYSSIPTRQMCKLIT